MTGPIPKTKLSPPVRPVLASTRWETCDLPARRRLIPLATTSPSRRRCTARCFWLEQAAAEMKAPD